jgi:hypothetical protein
VSSERRDAPRHLAALNAQIETDSGRFTIGLTHDVSATGLLVLSHQPLEPGLRLTIYVLVAGQQFVVRGRVVRQEPLGKNEAQMWRSKAAIAVDAQEPDLAKILAAIGR